MSRTKVSVPDVAEVAPGLWSNAIRAGDMLFISGQVARPFEGGTGIVGKDEYEQTFGRICIFNGLAVVKMTHPTI